MERVIKRGFSKSNSTPSASTSHAYGASKTASLLDIPEEVLVPGALYADWIIPDMQMQVNESTNKNTRKLPYYQPENDSWPHNVP
jgi:hypothetical protein